MSLALFEDSVRYKVNYYKGLFRYDKNQCCEFLNCKCIIDGSTKFPNEFNIYQNLASMCLRKPGRGFSSLSSLNSQLNLYMIIGITYIKVDLAKSS